MYMYINDDMLHNIRSRRGREILDVLVGIFWVSEG